MKSVFKAAFYLRSNHVNKDGKSMVMLRCSLNGERANFGSTGIGVDPKTWDCTKSRVKGKNTEALSTNLQLSNLEDLVTSLYYKYEKTDKLSLERIKQDYLGKTVSTETIMELFEAHNEDVKKQVGCGGLSTTSYSKYELVRKRFAQMILKQYRRKDLRLTEVTPFVIHDFELYLRTEIGQSPNTATKTLKTFKSVILFGIRNGLMTNNPFANIRFHLKGVDRGYLEDDELNRLMNKEIGNKRLSLIRDLFVFSCFTGLAYIDLANLKGENIVTLNGVEWIKGRRVKTGTLINVVLLDIPKRLILKYTDDKRRKEHLFPIISNQKMNEYLKEIAAICDIDKNLTCHIARHTFATMALSKGVPIESVSKMLGHTNIRTTQIYAKVTDKKIEHDMEGLAEQMGKFNQSAEKGLFEDNEGSSKAAKV
ncbi:MAG: site-specific integrase [Prevotella sp.]|nr:site-specific integrase [Prevotella sp.]